MSNAIEVRPGGHASACGIVGSRIDETMQHPQQFAKTTTANGKNKPIGSFKEMPLPREDVDATTAKFLRDKYAIVGVGETAYTRGSNKTTRALATVAVREAMVFPGRLGIF